jgi:hypothetical protein
MKCVVTLPTNEKAQETRGFLRSKGIEAKVTVDPVDGFYPSHSEVHHGHVAVMVQDKDAQRAISLLPPTTPLRKAG